MSETANSDAAVRRSTRIRNAPVDEDVLPSQQDLMGSFRYRSAAAVRASAEQTAPEPSEFLEVTWTSRMEQPLAIVTNMPLAGGKPAPGQGQQFETSSSGMSTSSSTSQAPPSSSTSQVPPSSSTSQVPLHAPSMGPSRPHHAQGSSSSSDDASSDGLPGKAEKARLAGNPHFAYMGTNGPVHYNAIGPLPHNAHLNYVTLGNMAPWIGQGPPRSRSNSPPDGHDAADAAAAHSQRGTAAGNGQTVTQQMLGKALEADYQAKQVSAPRQHNGREQQQHTIARPPQQHQHQHQQQRGYGPWPDMPLHNGRTISPPNQHVVRTVSPPHGPGYVQQQYPTSAMHSLSRPFEAGSGPALPSVANLLAPQQAMRANTSPPGSAGPSNGAPVHIGSSGYMSGSGHMGAWPSSRTHRPSAPRTISPPSTPNIFSQSGIPALYLQQGGQMPVAPQQPFGSYSGAFGSRAHDMALVNMQLQHLISQRHNASLSADEQQVALTMTRFSDRHGYNSAK